MSYINPYYGTDFFTFFKVLFTRLFSFPSELYSDEIQLIVLMGVALSSALVGTLLVLRKMTMLANSLSHTILIGIVIAFLLTQDDHGININALLFGALVMGVVTTFLTDFFTQWVKLQRDASIGLVFTSLFALGIVLLTLLTKNVHIGTEAVMGNVDALHVEDIQLVLIVATLNLLSIFFLYKEWQITTFDPPLAAALGISTTFFTYLLMIQVSATAIGAFRSVGVLMVLAFMTGPPLTARFLTHSLKKVFLFSALIGMGASLIAVALTRHMLSVYGVALSTGGVTVIVIALAFCLGALFHTKNELKARFTLTDP